MLLATASQPDCASGDSQGPFCASPCRQMHSLARQLSPDAQSGVPAVATCTVWPATTGHGGREGTFIMHKSALRKTITQVTAVLCFFWRYKCHRPVYGTRGIKFMTCTNVRNFAKTSSFPPLGYFPNSLDAGAGVPIRLVPIHG